MKKFFLIILPCFLISAQVLLGEGCVDLWDADYNKVQNTTICPGNLSFLTKLIMLN